MREAMPNESCDDNGNRVRMGTKDVESSLRDIAQIAVAQRDGAYTPQSDAMTALELISRLATLLAEERRAVR